MITHFCPSPGQEIVASVAEKEKGFTLRIGHQESQFNSFSASVLTFFFSSSGFWALGGRWEGWRYRGRRQLSPFPLEAPKLSVVAEPHSAVQVGRFPK